MTEIQRNQITGMRAAGLSYGKIAESLGIPQNTVKSYCVRHGIKVSAVSEAVSEQHQDKTLCESCGAEIVQNLKGKHKRFCCDSCRNAWWNSYPKLINRKAIYEHTCRRCGKQFTAYEEFCVLRYFLPIEDYLREKTWRMYDEETKRYLSLLDKEGIDVPRTRAVLIPSMMISIRL